MIDRRIRVLAAALACGCVGGFAVAQQPPPTVLVARVAAQEIVEDARFSGRVEAMEAVDVQARVQGFLERVAFEPGAFVEPGAALFQIEPDLYETRLAAARAELAGAEAALRQAERNLARQRELADRGTVATAALDEATAAFESAEAQLGVAEVAVRQAELELGYTRIASPIAGRVGRALFSPGALVGPETGPLARVVQLDPIRVVFAITERELTDLRQSLADGGPAIDPDALSLTVELPNGSSYDRPGRFEFVASEVDRSTGTVSVRAVFDNPDAILLPNQFVTLTARSQDGQRLPVAPQTAILQDREGRYVYVLRGDETVERRVIRTGARTAGGWAVVEGLEEGEAVVVSGVQRLSDGAPVTVGEEPAAEGSGQ